MVSGKDDTITNNRPYPPPSNAVAVLQRLRSRNLPDQIDAEYLRDAQVSEGTISRTLFALRFLGLITEGGGLTESLKSIHTSTDEEYQSILAGLIREAYSEVFNVVDPAEDTQDKILNVFRRYTPASQRDRMVVFFLGMCREAGIPTLDVPRARAMRTTRPAVQSARKTAPKEKVTQKQQLEVETRLNPALEGLIRALPEQGETLTKERREQWLMMAEATLQFLYPEQAELPADIHESEETKDEDTE